MIEQPVIASLIKGQLLDDTFEINEIISKHSIRDGMRFKGIGSVFYHEPLTYEIKALPEAINAPKIRNLIVATRGKRHLLEIGFNAGHSALLTLHSNPDLIYHGVDICQAPYTAECAGRLKYKYPNRFFFYRGDSREILPYLATHHSHLKFDVFHVDGGHTAEICRTDISNCLRLASQRSLLVLDDSDAPHIFDVYAEFVSLGYLRTENFAGNITAVNQVVAQIVSN